MKVKMIALTTILFCCTHPLRAGEKSQEFKGTMDQVWTACIRAAGEKFTLLFSDRSSGILTFQTGHSIRSNGFNVSANLKETDEKKIEVSISTQKNNQLWAFGAGGSIAKKYFKAVQENLNKKHYVEPERVAERNSLQIPSTN